MSCTVTCTHLQLRHCHRIGSEKVLGSLYCIKHVRVACVAVSLPQPVSVCSLLFSAIINCERLLKCCVYWGRCGTAAAWLYCMFEERHERSRVLSVRLFNVAILVLVCENKNTFSRPLFSGRWANTERVGSTLGNRIYQGLVTEVPHVCTTRRHGQ